MTRQAAEDLVKAKTIKIDQYSAVRVVDAKRLLGVDAFDAMMADAVRSAGPHDGYVYPWNVVDYLSGAIAVKPVAKSGPLLPFVFIANYLFEGNRTFGTLSGEQSENSDRTPYRVAATDGPRRRRNRQRHGKLSAG